MGSSSLGLRPSLSGGALSGFAPTDSWGEGSGGGGGGSSRQRLRSGSAQSSPTLSGASAELSVGGALRRVYSVAGLRNRSNSSTVSQELLLGRGGRRLTLGSPQKMLAGSDKRRIKSVPNALNLQA